LAMRQVCLPLPGNLARSGWHRDRRPVGSGGPRTDGPARRTRRTEDEEEDREDRTGEDRTRTGEDDGHQAHGGTVEVGPLAGPKEGWNATRCRSFGADGTSVPSPTPGGGRRAAPSPPRGGCRPPT